jgi:preprotein translocase subunit YajC
MDFIERIFGFSPDSGSGVFELLILALPVLGIIYFALRRRNRAKRLAKSASNVPVAA